jgi:anti-anti-sigma factor
VLRGGYSRRVPGDSFHYGADEATGDLVLTGDLDEPTTLELRELIRQATSGLQRDLTLDLTGVTFLPSIAVGVLATSQVEARGNGAALVLVAADGSIAQRVLRVCGVSYLESCPEGSELQPG